jgi:3'-5' exoribonuclease
MLIVRMPTLPPAARIDATSAGWGFFLCTRKDTRTGRQGRPFLFLMLQDTSGAIPARILDDVSRWEPEFDAGEFVKVQARADRHHERVELVIETIRRVNPDQDRRDGFREDLCVPAAPRPIDEMWSELEAVVARVSDGRLRGLLEHVMRDRREALRTWPAAVTVHHAYRGGLLEHVLQIATVGAQIAEAYGGDPDLVIAGALLHDIGKLDELQVDPVTAYSLEGNLVGHIALGVRILHAAAAQVGDIPQDLLVRLSHLILSHHGERELGSPVEPMMTEAFILSAVDNLDATLNQVRRHVSESGGDGEFTPYHPRLGRVLLRPGGRPPAARG